MDSTERRHEILQLVVEGRGVRVADLAQQFGVSEVTIRADLKLLDERGMVSRTHGGAVASNRIMRELSLSEKSVARTAIKRKLAAAACDLIADGESIILDSGSTTAEIAKLLPRFDQLVVMTNGLNVALNVSDASNVQIMMTGGMLRSKSQSFFGRHAEAAFLHYNFDKLFLGVDGIDLRAGITTHFEPEALLNRRMCEVAKEVIAVSDSSKFNLSGVHKICSLADLDVLVTDSGVPPEFIDALEDHGVRLVIVEA